MVRKLTKDDLVTIIIIGALEGLFYFIGDTIRQVDGFIVGVFIVIALNVLIYLATVIGTRS